VLLLFYLAPLWTIFLSRLLLGEKAQPRWCGRRRPVAGRRSHHALAPRTRSALAVQRRRVDGYAAGFLFALSNVMVRQTTHLSIERKSLAVFLGVVLPGLLVMPFDTGPAAGGELRMQGWHWAMLILVGVILLLINLIVQHGLTRTAAKSGRRHISLRAGGRRTVVLAARRRSHGTQGMAAAR